MIAFLKQWAWAIALAAIFLAFVGGYIRGHEAVQVKWDAEKKANAAADNLRQVKGDAFTTVFVTRVVERVKEIRVKGDTIVKEIPVYVTPQDDIDYRVNRGFVRVLNAAIEGNPLAGAAEGTDRAPAGVALSTLAGVLSDDFTTCHLYRQRADDLTTWYNEQRAIANSLAK